MVYNLLITIRKQLFHSTYYNTGNPENIINWRYPFWNIKNYADICRRN